MNSSVNSTDGRVTFNISKQMIAGLIANDPKAQKCFLSKEEGIYRILCKQIYADWVPEYIRAEYREGGNDDIVLSFTAELYEKGKFSKEKLEKLHALYDASLFEYVKSCAIRHLQDKIRAYNRNIKSRLATDDSVFNKATSKLAAENQMRQLENKEFLRHILAAAKLNKFQVFIINHMLEGYEPDEILDEYGRMENNQKLTKNYYYSQKSLAMKELMKVSAGYTWR